MKILYCLEKEADEEGEQEACILKKKLFFSLFFFLSLQWMYLYARKWTHTIHKNVVNVSSQPAYLITCLCTLVQLVVSGLSTFPAVFVSSFFSPPWLYDCLLCGSYGVLCCCCCCFIGNLFCIFLWEHCALAFSSGLIAIEIYCIVVTEPAAPISWRMENTPCCVTTGLSRGCVTSRCAPCAQWICPTSRLTNRPVLSNWSPGQQWTSPSTCTSHSPPRNL